MHAIIETGGKQYKVTEGDVIYVEKLPDSGGETVAFDRIIAVFENDKIKFGTPYVTDVKVEGKIIKTGKSKKIMIFKYNAKKNYRRRQGHRQPYTKVSIEKVAVL